MDTGKVLGFNLGYGFEYPYPNSTLSGEYRVAWVNQRVLIELGSLNLLRREVA